MKLRQTPRVAELELAPRNWVRMLLLGGLIAVMFTLGSAPHLYGQVASPTPGTSAPPTPSPPASAESATPAPSSSSVAPAAAPRIPAQAPAAAVQRPGLRAAPPTMSGPVAATPTAPASPLAPAGSAPMDAATYTVRLRDLESRVEELKEQIRRSHTRLSLLSDTVLSGGIGGATAEIVFRNDLSNAFRVTGVLFVLDGIVQYKKKDDTGALSNQKTIPIFSGSVPPGDHTLQVVVDLQGHGYGVFSYLRGYKWTHKTTHSFSVTEGNTIKVDAVGWEKGDATTPLEQRPGVRFATKVLSREEVRAASISGSGEK
ncbi:MAG: hypothetical protein RJA70_1548 [Pseudomonadota bacterium]